MSSPGSRAIASNVRSKALTVQNPADANTTDGGWERRLGGDLLARPALTPQPLDLSTAPEVLAGSAMRRDVRSAILKPSRRCEQPCEPYVGRPYGFSHGLRVCPLAISPTSSSRAVRRHSGAVFPVLSRILSFYIRVSRNDRMKP